MHHLDGERTIPTERAPSRRNMHHPDGISTIVESEAQTNSEQNSRNLIAWGPQIWMSLAHLGSMLGIFLEFMISLCPILRNVVFQVSRISDSQFSKFLISQYLSFTHCRNPEFGYSKNYEVQNCQFQQVSKSTTPEYINSSSPKLSSSPNMHLVSTKLPKIISF